MITIIFEAVETKRLVLRECRPADFNAIHEYGSDPEVSIYLPWGPNSEADTGNYLDSILSYQFHNPRKDYEIAIVLKETDLLIGVCSIHITNDKTREGFIGYCYNRQYWGKGYASEAAKAILEFGFMKLNLHRIFATCDPKNVGSSKVLEKIGMKREGHLREHKLQRGKWRDSYLYSILEHEFSHK
ncbi:MAG: family N-acetyltransferase [Clostridia bacterium]|nr:family N-acetyltransferase [Clostridia bacterium]